MATRKKARGIYGTAAIFMAAIFVAAFVLSACAPGEGAESEEIPKETKEIFAMDTVMSVTCYGDNSAYALQAAEEEIERLDELLSVGKESSEISVLNEEGSGKLSEDSLLMIEKALEIYEGTGGAFDITVYPLMELWGFTSGDFRVPSAGEITETLCVVGSEKLSLEGDVLTLGEGQGIDLGGIAKGYTSDRIMEIFKEYGIVSGMVSLGGNVQLLGTKTDGSLWRCGIRDPLAEDEQELFGVLSAKDCAVITSGAYERYFEGEDGERYHHIIDPQDGYPARSGIISATIVSERGIEADALSTACYVLGLEKSTEYWRESDLEFDMILMTEDGDVYITEGIEGSFETDRTLHVLTKEE